MRYQQYRTLIIICASALLTTTFWGCAEVADKVEPTFASLWDKSFSGCGLNCHLPSPGVSDGTQNGPDLSSQEKFYSNLVNKTVNDDYPEWERGGDCNDVKFIAPGDANQSTVAASLIQSVSDTLGASDNCATSFNLHEVGKATITNKDIQTALIDWINNGAENN